MTPLPRFESKLRESGRFPLRAAFPDTLQVNVGKHCNQACAHCHVEAGPHRTERMSRQTAEEVITALERSPQIHTVDITGGAPELNSNFWYLVTEARRLGKTVIDRCNLTVLFLPGQENTAKLLRENFVQIIASLPCYTAENTDSQRGAGVFEQSIAGLRRLNDLGYGQSDGPSLTLVYNPGGAFLPPPQAELEDDYRRELGNRYGIVFTRLSALTNMPIRRFLHFLERRGEYEQYMELLAQSFNPAAAENVMCRSLISVGWDGALYDCDFNQMLEMPVTRSMPQQIRDFDAAALAQRRIVTGQHCFGCTAGAGSSCGGALVPPPS